MKYLFLIVFSALLMYKPGWQGSTIYVAWINNTADENYTLVVDDKIIQQVPNTATSWYGPCEACTKNSSVSITTTRNGETVDILPTKVNIFAPPLPPDLLRLNLSENQRTFCIAWE